MDQWQGNRDRGEFSYTPKPGDPPWTPCAGWKSRLLAYTAGANRKDL